MSRTAPTNDRQFPKVIEVVVEIPRGSRNKYEFDEPTFTGCHVWARPVGGFEMRDEKGFDFKVLCVAVGDPHQAHVETLDNVRPHRLVEIENFFETYKLLEDKTVEVIGWRDTKRALEVLEADHAAWLDEAGRSKQSG